jgi:hypothetical protein
MLYLPALIGLISKIAVLFYARAGRKWETTFVSLVLIFTCVNAIELLGYLRFLDGLNVSSFLRLYYVAAIFAFMSLSLHNTSVSKIKNHLASTLLILIAVVLASTVLWTDVIIAGSHSIGYAITATKGNYYFLFSFYVVATLIGNVVLLLHSRKKATTSLDAIRCLYSLVAFTPLFVLTLIVVGLKTFDIAINAAVLVPIMTTLFLFIMLKGESEHQLTDIRRLLPLSLERKMASKMATLIDSYTQKDNQQDAFNNLRHDIEKEIILYSLKVNANNISGTAKMMGLQSRSTLYSMMKRLKIDHSSYT